MPRYFFHVSGDVPAFDECGIDLASHAEARTEAARLVGGMLMENPDLVWTQRDWTLRVTDEAGLILYSLTVLGHASAAVPKLPS